MKHADHLQAPAVTYVLSRPAHGVADLATKGPMDGALNRKVESADCYLVGKFLLLSSRTAASARCSATIQKDLTERRSKSPELMHPAMSRSLIATKGHIAAVISAPACGPQTIT